MKRIEYTTDSDRFYSYCLWEYEPVSPSKNKWRSANLLYHTFELMNVDERAFDIVETIRAAFGVSNSIWGVKWADGRFKWEFYFYDYRRRERERSISLFLESVKPLVPCDLKASENLHYFMFSVDLDNDLFSGRRGIDEIHMYIGNPGSDVSSGISYSLTQKEKRMENFYFFFDPKRHMDDIIAKVCCSAHIDSPMVEIEQILWPELMDCKTICLANKQKNDCVYFSGVNFDQFLFFLIRMKYPEQIVAYIRGNRAVLDYLLYDVGIDYRMENGRVEFLKSGYYGNF